MLSYYNHAGGRGVSCVLPVVIPAVRRILLTSVWGEEEEVVVVKDIAS